MFQLQRDQFNISSGWLYKTIIGQKLITLIELNLAEGKYGFRKGRSTIDLIFGLHQVIENHYEYNKLLWFVSIDIKKAFWCSN